MVLKVSLILLMASSAMSSAPQSLYFTYPATTASVLNKQPYPLYQTFIRQPSYQLPLYQQNYQFLPQPTIAKRPVFQVQPSAFQSQPLPAFQADTRKIVLQETRPPPSQEVTHRPNYSFAYSVNDEKSGDQKSHQETRNGDNVIGKYTVVEPDGTLRIVTYTAGKEGFNAIVERQPPQLVQQKPVTVIKQFPVRKIVAAQSQPVIFKPIVQAQAIASAAPTLAFGNYYYN